MLTDEEKKQKGIENLKAFNEKIIKIFEEEKEDLSVKELPTYVKTVSNNVESSYLWSEESISPTAVLKFINKRNNTTKKRSEWVQQIKLDKVLYDRLVTMYDDFEKPLFIEDVKVIY